MSPFLLKEMKKNETHFLRGFVVENVTSFTHSEVLETFREI